MLLATASVVWGLLLSTSVLRGTPSLKLHRFLGTLTLAFTGVHVAGLVFDSYVHFGWLELLIPFASSWRPVPVALGIVTMYLLVAVHVSSIFMKRMPRAWWRRIHLSSYLLFWTGLVHGATSGADAGRRWYAVATITSILIVTFLTLLRALKPTRGRRSVSPRPVAPTP